VDYCQGTIYLVTGYIIRIRAGDFVFILSYGLFMNLLVNDVFKVLLKKVGLSR